MTAWVASHEERSISAAFLVPEFDPQQTETPPDNILRWEDDGGTTIEVCDPRLHRQDLLTKGSLRG